MPPALLLAAALFLPLSGCSDSTGTAQTEQTTPDAPASALDATSPGEEASNKTGSTIPPERVAAQYVDAYAHFDRARLKSVLGGEALAAWQTNLSRFNRSDEAMEFTILPGHCSPQSSSGTDTTVTCTFDMHGLGSEQLGLGPYSNNDFGIVVRDGKVVQADMHFDYGNNGFAGQMWEPFMAWLTRNHPQDIPQMLDSYDNPLPDPASIRLWHRHIEEYVAAKSS